MFQINLDEISFVLDVIHRGSTEQTLSFDDLLNMLKPTTMSSQLIESICEALRPGSIFIDTNEFFSDWDAKLFEILKILKSLYHECEILDFDEYDKRIMSFTFKSKIVGRIVLYHYEMMLQRYIEVYNDSIENFDNVHCEYKDFFDSSNDTWLKKKIEERINKISKMCNFFD